MILRLCVGFMASLFPRSRSSGGDGIFGNPNLVRQRGFGKVEMQG
jgi:hypothetical protein